jgi:glycosyltransferase involved in cell wall biosynthesis
MKCCVIVPTYNNDATLARILDETLQYTSQVIVVDDGSTDDTGSILSGYADIDILRLPENRGKGYALRTAFNHAIKRGYAYAITIDSDGQHMTSDFPAFLSLLETEREAVIIGARNMDQSSVPVRSNFGRKFSNFWFLVETGISLPDTQSGFRLYPLSVLKTLSLCGKKFELETEVLVRAAWKGCTVLSIPVTVYYAPKAERVSHFRPFTDFSRVSVMNTVLVFLALLYFRPLLFFRKLRRQDPKKFLREQFLHSDDSSAKLACSVAAGALTAILPIWGYQLILALFLAYLFRLNKVVTIVASNISIPPMIPLVIYGSLLTGESVLGGRTGTFQYSTALNIDVARNNIQIYLVGSIALSILVSIVSGGITYLLMLVLRKKHRRNS